jgi:hypothetical protein
MIRRRSALMILLLLTSCSDSPSRRPDNIAIMPSRLATQVMLFENACPGAEPGPERVVPLVAILVTTLAPVAADVAVRGLMAHLEEQQDQLSATYIGRGMGHLTTSGREPPVCLVIARGQFGALDHLVQDGDKEGTLTVRHLKDTGLATWPDLYFQARLEHPDQQQMRTFRGANTETGGPAPDDVIVLHPELLHYAATAAARTRSGQKSIGMVLLITRATIDPKAEDPGGAVVAKVPLVAERLPIGIEISDPIALRDLGAAVPLPAHARDQTLNFYVVVQETEDPNQLSKLILEALGSHQDELTATLSQILQQLAGTNGGSREQDAGAARG